MADITFSEILISTDFFLSLHTVLSLLSSLCALCGYGVVVVTAWWWLRVVVVTAWWWLVTAWWWLRRGGGYAWWWLRVVVVGYGVVVVKSPRRVGLRRDPRRVGGYGETHGVLVVTERPTAWLFSQILTTEASHHQGETHAWLSSQICPDRGQPPPRREARTTVVEPSDLHGGFWLLNLLVFGC
uniref:Uncharacterized protein n=1 Tax=Fagus sylvatica TaxID=28930 RepID=A0A2N9J8X1_FAGSY